MSKILILALCVASAAAVPKGHRAKRAIGEAVSSSFSAAGTGIGSGLAVGSRYGMGTGLAMGPALVTAAPTIATAAPAVATGVTTSPEFVGEVFRYPNTVYPAYGMNNAFQQFLETASAAHVTANEDPVFAKVYKQQMAILAHLQQMAKTRYPFAFPGFGFGNTFATPLGTWNTAPVVTGYVPRVMPTGTDSAVYTSGAVSYGTPGGYGVVSSFPGGPSGLGVRVAEEFPAPVGVGPYGTFSSSSSGVSSVNGETTSYKTSTVGVNDNGRITFRTVSD